MGLLWIFKGSPRSAVSWSQVAEMHPEFFRFKKEQSQSPVSLVSRHVLPKNDKGVRNLTPEFVGQLIDAAVNLHDRQVKRSERWVYLVPIWVALIAAIGAIVAGLVSILTKVWFGCS